MKVTLIEQSDGAVKKVADIASICYGRDEAKNPQKLVEKLVELGHGSVLEHAYFTWKIEGISRACLAQLVRHRHASYTVRSQRYCDESGFVVVVPDSILEKPELLQRWDNLLSDISRLYQDMRDDGIRKEDARYILPMGTETELYFSCNLRELIHIYRLRTDKAAQWEIRELVQQLVETIDEELHFIFKGCDV